MAITAIYSMACVGSTLVRYIHSITQEWREECTSGLFFRFWYFFWCWRCVGLWLQRRGGAVWMTMMQLNDVSIQSQKANSSSPTALPMTPLSLHSTMRKLWNIPSVCSSGLWRWSDNTIDNQIVLLGFEYFTDVRRPGTVVLLSWSVSDIALEVAHWSRHPIWIFCVGSATKVPREERKEGKVVSDQQYSNQEVITMAVLDIITVAVLSS